MKKILFLMLFVTACCDYQHFKYQEKVKIIRGFYKDCTAQLSDQEGNNSYKALITCGAQSFSGTINRNDIAKMGVK